MMKTLSRRLLSAAPVALAVVLSPQGAFAQDATVATGDPTASAFIGGLVVWLLAIGGIIAVGVMSWADKSAQAGRTSISTRR